MASVYLSVAHTVKAPGARTASGAVVEHPFSAKVCASACRVLEAEGYDVRVISGSKTAKIKAVNGDPDAALVVEPHLNAAIAPLPPIPDDFNPIPEGLSGEAYDDAVDARREAWRAACPERPSPIPRGHSAIYWHTSRPSKLLAIDLSDALQRGFYAARYEAARRWGAVPCPGPLVRLPDLPLLSATRCPAVIVEGAYVTNPDDAAWLERPDSPDLLGAWIAAGISVYLRRQATR